MKWLADKRCRTRHLITWSTAVGESLEDVYARQAEALSLGETVHELLQVDVALALKVQHGEETFTNNSRQTRVLKNISEGRVSLPGGW